VLVYLVAKETTGSRGTNPKSTKVGFVHCSGYNKLFCRIKKGAVINQGRRKPLEGYLMINVGGAFDETKGPRGSAAVIRDTGAHSSLQHTASSLMSWMHRRRKLRLLGMVSYWPNKLDVIVSRSNPIVWK
jgi:hypothetical protein